jgi:hypothetical protein
LAQWLIFFFQNSQTKIVAGSIPLSFMGLFSNTRSLIKDPSNTPTQPSRTTNKANKPQTSTLTRAWFVSGGGKKLVAAHFAAAGALQPETKRENQGQQMGHWFSGSIHRFESSRQKADNVEAPLG